jgi:hypothetical protein
MPALTFNNTSGNSKFSGSVVFEGKPFDYDIYLLPLTSQNERGEIIQRISSRKRYFPNGTEETCLGLDTTSITQMIDSNDVSAFGFVKEHGSQDEGSGSLQIFNWCSLKRKYNNELEISQVWINDVCRFTPKGTTKSVISPVKVLFLLFEQLTSQILNKNEIYLMVEPHEYPVLGSLYKKYGFNDVSKEDCKKNKGRDALNIMRKFINKNSDYNNFPFVEPVAPVLTPDLPDVSLVSEHIPLNTIPPVVTGGNNKRFLRKSKRKTNRRKHRTYKRKSRK